MNSEILELFCQSVADVGLFSWWSISDDGKFQRFVSLRRWGGGGRVGFRNHCFRRRSIRRQELDRRFHERINALANWRATRLRLATSLGRIGFWSVAGQ